jgi:tRNA pseudouridine32 synthase/23S rRNA pseudouridine746 synthase
VTPLLTWLSPQPPDSALPTRFPNPFDDVAPHPLAQEEALKLQAQLRTGLIAPGVSTQVLETRREGGKMFGVLLVRAPDGRVGVLRGFSGQLGWQWELPGWVPPLFDPTARDVVESGSDVLVNDFTGRLQAHDASPELAAARAALAAFDADAQARRDALKPGHAARKAARKALRETLAPDDLEGRQRLDNESRADDFARKKLERALTAERLEVERPLARLNRHRGALERLRRLISQEAMRRIQDCYRLENFAGSTRLLRTLFAPVEPPWGTGDCAAPKLLGYARAQGLTPLALAEFWWGPPPPGGGRVEGMFFPSCREKCGPLLPFLLEGVDLAPRQTWKPRAVGEGELVTLHEDARIVVVLKPAGLLSVPARDTTIIDSAWARLRARYPQATGPLLVHRLDLDTSGLLVAALDEDAYRLLQAQFVARTVEKRYAAWLEGVVPGARGTIALPLRVDLDQRPRQLVDFEHGKPAITDWEVLRRTARRTRVAFTPHTGRTHQLRVHASHAQGLGCPIVGDRLYGTPAERLFLHAEALAFDHPDGQRLRFVAEAPFDDGSW